MKRTTLLALAALLTSSCSGGEDDGPLQLARPVSVLTLEETLPPPGNLVPGIVAPYRQTEIAFEVTGRIQRVVDVGEEVLGEQVDRKGVLLQAGDVLAELDPAPLERALKQAEQRLLATRRQLEAQVVQLETVLVARLDSARSQSEAAELNASYARDDVKAFESAVSLARTTLERNRELLPTGAVSDIAVRQSENDLQAQESRLAQARTLVTTRERELDAARAAIAEVQGNQALQEATNAALEANIAELEEAVADARSDLEDCALRAPFPGRVTEQHAGEGSFVSAGTPIVTLTMMNPIQVEITVSAEVDESIIVGTDASIYPMSGNQVDFSNEVRATVYDKQGVADVQTRTFRIGMICPNKRRVVRPELAGFPTAAYLIPIFDNPLDLPGERGLFTIIEAVSDIDDDPSVLRVLGLSQGARSTKTLNGKLRAERIPVELGPQTIQVASFRLVELLDARDRLSPGDLLVPEPTPAHEAGFVVDDNRWLLRPGDLVQVSLERRERTAGFYVPVQAIRELNGATSVFVVDESDKVRSVPVELLETSGELRRLVSSELAAGDVVVHRGVHFLRDGDPIVRQGATAGDAR